MLKYGIVIMLKYTIMEKIMTSFLVAVVFAFGITWLIKFAIIEYNLLEACEVLQDAVNYINSLGLSASHIFFYATVIFLMITGLHRSIGFALFMIFCCLVGVILISLLLVVGWWVISFFASLL